MLKCYNASRAGNMCQTRKHCFRNKNVCEFVLSLSGIFTCFVYYAAITIPRGIISCRKITSKDVHTYGQCHVISSPFGVSGSTQMFMTPKRPIPRTMPLSENGKYNNHVFKMQSTKGEQRYPPDSDFLIIKFQYF